MQTGWRLRKRHRPTSEGKKKGPLPRLERVFLLFEEMSASDSCGLGKKDLHFGVKNVERLERYLKDNEMHLTQYGSPYA
jgi:hypothetical protein